jgi:hypothetical protein
MGQKPFFYKIKFFLSFLSIIFFARISYGVTDEGLSFKTKYLHPGKTDFHYLHTKTTNEYNFIWWSPIFKGGTGIIDYDNKDKTEYSGGYLRPLLPKSGKGELILGFLEVNTASAYSYEFQGEYRFPFGLGFGGGTVSRSNGGSDVEFEKISYRNKYYNWNFILETQYQKIAHNNSLGGYAAIYNKQIMFVFGDDGEQWRSTIGYIAKENKTIFRPSFEALYVDNTIGKIDGNKFLFINATLKFKGGFLSHPARLGRAMGPTGLEFGNPLGFLSPTWNRRLDTWELGELGDLRVVRTEKPSGSVTEKYEALVYPFQFDNKKNLLDYFYLGNFYSRKPGENSSGILGGFFGKFNFLITDIGELQT